MALVLGVALAIVAALSSVMWERGRATFGMDEGGREPVDVVAMSAPVVAGVRQELVPAVQAQVPPLHAVRVPAATIVEMPVQGIENPMTVDRAREGARAGPAEVRPPKGAMRGANARVSLGETVRGSAARSQPKRGGGRKADARHAAPRVRMQSEISKDIGERVDADVQVIEAIVTRSR